MKRITFLISICLMVATIIVQSVGIESRLLDNAKLVKEEFLQCQDDTCRDSLIRAVRQELDTEVAYKHSDSINFLKGCDGESIISVTSVGKSIQQRIHALRDCLSNIECLKVIKEKIDNESTAEEYIEILSLKFLLCDERDDKCREAVVCTLEQAIDTYKVNRIDSYYFWDRPEEYMVYEYLQKYLHHFVCLAELKKGK